VIRHPVCAGLGVGTLLHLKSEVVDVGVDAPKYQSQDDADNADAQIVYE
jgi:hypothetical protein